jgi:preprotein translocase subunit SecY
MRLFASQLTLEGFSVLALGVMLYLGAYTVVEILSLLVQPLKSWRTDGYSGRIKIRKITLIAEPITRMGIGRGISILIFTGYGPWIFSKILQIRLISHKHSPFEYFLLFAMIIFALTALIVLMEKSRRKILVRFNDGLEAIFR